MRYYRAMRFLQNIAQLKKLTAMHPSTICPECGSPNIILHADGEQECCDCGFFWTGHYLLR